MYNVLEDINGTTNMMVMDLTKYEIDEFGFPTLYAKENVQTFSFKDSYINLSEFGGNEKHNFPINDKYIEEADSYYNNIEINNPNWPSKLQILQDYGNHEGYNNEPIDESLILLGNVPGSDSFGWFDGYFVFITKYMDNLFIWKLVKHDEPIDISNVNVKRPFNSGWYVADPFNFEENIKVWYSIRYNLVNEEDNKYLDEHNTIELPLKIKNIYNPRFMNFTMGFYKNGYN